MTKQNWKIGKNTGCVVSDVEPTAEDIRSVAGDTSYYGGVLICESIRTPDNARLIACAPKMEYMIKQTIQALESPKPNDDGTITQSFGQIFLDSLKKSLEP